MKTRVIGGMVVSVFFAVAAANAAVVASFTDGDNSPSGSNLLSSNLSSSSGISSPDDSSVIWDGVALTSAEYGTKADASGWGNDMAQATDGNAITFDFDTGIDISSIDIYHGWKDTGRDGIDAFTVEVAPFDDSDNYSEVLDHNGPTMEGAGEYKYGITSVSDDGEGDVGTGVGSLKITFDTWENGAGPYSEIEVIDSSTVPEPASWSLLMMAGAFIVLRRRRRC